MTRDEKSRRKAPTAFDLHVAARIRERRIEQGHSQPALAEAIGVSFQQVQKYENGRNRISASRLQAILAFLKVPPSFVYDGLSAALPSTAGFGEAPGAPYVADQSAGPAEGQAVMAAFHRIGDPRVRRVVLELMTLLAGPPQKPPRRARRKPAGTVP